jgi:hypothetical protein
MGGAFIATATHNGVKLRATSTCGPSSAALNLALRAFYGGNTKDYRAMAQGLRVECVGKGFCSEEFEASETAGTGAPAAPVKG